MIFLSRMLAITRGHRGLVAIAVAGSVFYTALSVLPALIIRQMLTVLSRPSPAGTLVLLGLAMLGATALMAVARYLEGGFGHIAAFKVLHDMRMRIYEQLQRLSMGFHTRQQSGTIAAKVIGDVETIEFFTAHAGILFHTWSFSVVEWMAAIPVALVLLVGGLMAHAGELGIPDLVLFVFLTTQLYRPVTELNRQLEGLRNAEAATDRIFKILNAPIEVQEAPSARVPRDPRYGVVLDHVIFAYETGRPVLHDVSIDLKEGSVLALVGPSGAGKTTVANLIARFWDPQEGAVRLGGVGPRGRPLGLGPCSSHLVLP